MHAVVLKKHWKPIFYHLPTINFRISPRPPLHFSFMLQQKQMAPVPIIRWPPQKIQPDGGLQSPVPSSRRNPLRIRNGNSRLAQLKLYQQTPTFCPKFGALTTQTSLRLSLNCLIFFTILTFPFSDIRFGIRPSRHIGRFFS